MNLEKLVFITCHHDFVESTACSVISIESRQLLLLNHWNVLEKLFVFYVCHLQVNIIMLQQNPRERQQVVYYGKS